jgi:hypothetical protein
MNIFDKDVEKKTIIVNGKKHTYIKEYYPYTKHTYFVFKCPKYFVMTLSAKFSKYGAMDSGNDKISVQDESVIPQMIEYIDKVTELVSKYHIGQNVISVHLGENSEPYLVFVGEPYDKNGCSYLVNHKYKKVSACHGYRGRGRNYAEKMNYTFIDV